MGLVVTYSSPTTPGGPGWSEDLSSAVRLGTIAGVVDEAELGAVGVSSLLFDDVDGTLGHSGDGIVGLKQLHMDETAAPPGNQRLWTGYIGQRHYRRGTDSLRLDVARKIDADLVDINGFLSFRIFAPVAEDPTSSFVRPAETDIERVAALLAVDFLSDTLYDEGLVATSGGVAMDACDYTGQKPLDVLNDCAQQSGRNFFPTYNEATGHYQLFYHFDYDPVFDSPLQISNVLADVDGITTFAPEPDAELVRNPDRVISAVYEPFSGTGSPAYRTAPTTAYTYAWRDGAAPSANVKTLTKANARADRYLATNSTEDDRITCTLRGMPAQYVTGIKAGQRVKCKFSHMPLGVSGTWGGDFAWCRVLNRSVMANELTNVLYNIRLELSPIVAVLGFHQVVLCSGFNDGTSITANGTYTLVWGGQYGGTPPSMVNGPPVIQDTDGYSGTPGDMQVGGPPITTLTIPAGLGGTYQVGMEGLNVVNAWWPVPNPGPGPNPQQVPYIYAGNQESCGQGVAGGTQVVTYDIRANGASVASHVWTYTGGLAYETPMCAINSPVVLAAGYVITVTVTFSGDPWPLWNFSTAYGAQIPAALIGAFFMTWLHA
jgi:hypothetical protein